MPTETISYCICINLENFKITLEKKGYLSKYLNIAI